MGEVLRRQDMPPSGGYKAIPFKRIPARTYFSGWALIGGYLGLTASAAYVIYLTDRSIHREDIEQRSGNFALYPMLLAEKDRAYLKQLRRNRDEEAKLMANVEGWKVGTWYGDKIYQTVPEDTLIEPRMIEYYIHAHPREFNRRANFTLWC